MPAKKGMVTTYDEQTVDKAHRQTDEVSEDIPSLEELQARALAQAKEDYERLLARKAEIEQLKKEAFKRKMRIGQLRKKLDGLKEERREVLRNMVNALADIFKYAEQDIALYEKAGNVAGELEMLGAPAENPCSYMIGGNLIVTDVERYVNAFLRRSLAKIREGAKPTLEDLEQVV